MDTAGRFDRTFAHHPPAGTQPERYESLRVKAREFAELIAASTPAGREQSLALTHLETAAMWANKAIAVGE